jgi:murein L,D-transpeptidase YcbB/YkuD
MSILVAGSGCGPDQHEIGIAIDEALDGPVFADSVPWVSDVREFYLTREMRPAWTGSRGLNARGRRVVALLDSAAHRGLDPARYATREIARLREAIENVDDVDDAIGLIAALDAQVTAGYRRYLGDLDGGAFVVDPEAADRPFREKASLVARLDGAARGEDPSEIAAAVEPVASQYTALRTALLRYTTIAHEGGWPEVRATGDTASEAEALRARLVAEGDPREKALALAADDTAFDAGLIDAIEHFQVRHGLDTTGELDEATLRELNTSVEDRIATISLNLDRWRALPRDTAPVRVQVNIPAFELVVLEDEDPVLEMKVVVGSVAHPTPVMLDTIEYVVTNPFWNVPASILGEEIAPAMANDPEYLRDRAMDIVARAAPSGVLDQDDIDWEDLDTDSIDWLVRQRPGSGNALGKVKFLFPNRMSIYLHDTPEKALFDRRVRARSHGCIRLERPLELARFIFERRVAAEHDLDELLAMDAERHVALGQGIPIRLLYLTAWADGESVRFFPDIYGRDERDAAEQSVLLRDPAVRRMATD